MRVITAMTHPPALAREAAHELSTALRDATETATRALQTASLPSPPRPHRHLVRHHADRSVPAPVRAWSAELVRLAETGVWLRRTVLDDIGVQLPDAVRVANYAAKGPHLAGLDFGNQSADQHRRIGIDLVATVDAVGRSRPTESEPV
jgi:hypothetical protein